MRVLRYLNGTIGIRMQIGEILNIPQANWLCALCLWGPLVWSSRIQSRVAQSAAEAELYPACAAVQEGVCKNLEEELRWSRRKKAPTLDNASVIALVRNKMHRKKLKHIALRHYCI